MCVCFELVKYILYFYYYSNFEIIAFILSQALIGRHLALIFFNDYF